MKNVGRVWYATAAKLYEVHLLEDHSAVVPGDGELGNRPFPLSLQWGLEGNTYVFKMRRMPEGVDQLKLPVVVEGGILTGNAKNAESFHSMLKGVALQAGLAQIMLLHGWCDTGIKNAGQALSEGPLLPTILPSAEPDDTAPAPTPVTLPQAIAEEDDGIGSDADDSD